MILITYRLILNVLLFLGPLLAAAAWIDMQSLPRSVAGGALRLRRIPALRVFVLMVVGVSAVHVLSVGYVKVFRPDLLTFNPHPYPYNTPFMGFFDFIDANIYVNRMAGLHTPAFWDPGFTVSPNVPVTGIAWMYPPFAVLPYAYLERGGMPVERLLVMCAVLLVVPLLGFARWLVGRGARPWAAYGFLIVCLLLSYPLWTEISTGNIELFVVALGAAAVLCYLRGRTMQAAVLVGLMTGLKLFPFIYFGLFFARKQYRQIACGLAVAVAVNVAGLWAMAPNMRLSLRLVRQGLADNRKFIILVHRVVTTEIDHSMFGVVKRVFFVTTHGNMVVPEGVLTVYLALGAVAGLVLYFARIVRMPVLNQILALCILSVVLPPTSHDYTLLHLYVPWALVVVMAVQAARAGRTVAGLVPCMVCFGLLFASEMELIYRGYSYNGQFKCVVLLVLLVFSLRTPWQLAELEEAGAPAA